MKTSLFRGVIFEPRRQNWKAQLQVNGRTRFLGRHDTERAAALAVDNARVYLQEFFPEGLGTYRFNFPITEQYGPASMETTDALRAILVEERAPTHFERPDAPWLNSVQKRATLVADLRVALAEATAVRDRVAKALKFAETVDLHLLDMEEKIKELAQQDRPPDPEPVAPDPKPPAPEPPRSVVLPPELHGHEERQPECLHEDPGPE